MCSRQREFMSSLPDEEEVLDEKISANGRNGHNRATTQQPIPNEEKESLNTNASSHQSLTAKPSNEKTEYPRNVDALEHHSVKSKTPASVAHDKSNELSQTCPEQRCSVPENDGSAFNVSNRPPPTLIGGPIASEKTQSQDQVDKYPEGGLRAWLVVLGSFSGMTASFGIANSVGTFQAYLSSHQLAHDSPSSVGWIFSLYAFLTFFCGVQVGPIFDAYGPRWLVFAGTVCLVGGMMGVAESTSECSLLLYIVTSLSSSFQTYRTPSLITPV